MLVSRAADFRLANNPRPMNDVSNGRDRRQLVRGFLSSRSVGLSFCLVLRDGGTRDPDEYTFHAVVLACNSSGAWAPSFRLYDTSTLRTGYTTVVADKQRRVVRAFSTVDGR
ncbi:unnamed protein product [Pylaiella littoralis]